MFQGFRNEKVETGDAVINCVIGGSGPPVLLLHGFPQTHAMWAKIAPILAQRYTVVAADLRGYGDSSKPALLPDHANYAFRAFANDNVVLMAHFGFDHFHMIGHDRGGRTGHRMALDHPQRVLSLAVLDIVPTYAMLMDTNRRVAGAYWHWYFLSLPAPFPERFISSDPDYFYETSLVGWGKTRLEDFDQVQLAAYRRCWRDPATIHGMTNDYRAATTIDLEHDAADIDRKVQCPTLAFWGSAGVMHGLFDMEAEWRKRCANLTCATLPGGHFFPDVLPAETAERLLAFVDAQT